MGFIDSNGKENDDYVLVYIAGTSSEAKSIESLFNGNDIIYILQHTPFLRSNAFSQIDELPGVGFYVPLYHAEFCRGLLAKQGYIVGLIKDGEE